MNHTLLGLAGAVVLGTLLCDLCRPPAARAAPAVAARAEAASVPALAPRTVTLRVEGMTCGGCAISTRIVLERLAGVRKAEVSYEQRLAVVTYDPEKVTVEQMIDALRTGLHYKATVVPEAVG